jgi:soluble lytic murein transglycosylase-like protein
VNREGSESLVELDVRAARMRRAAEARRARRARPTRRRRLRRPVLVLLIALGVGLLIVSGSIGVPELEGHGKLRRAAPCPVPTSLRPAFAAASKQTGLPISLLVAVGQVESRLDPNARSPAGAVGVLQLMPATAASLGADPNQVEQNVLAGARYLKLLLHRYGTDFSALAAYNAGPTAVDRAGGDAPSVETLAYVENVQNAWKSLAGCR